MKGIGLVLAIVGGFLIYRGYQASQSFGSGFNHAIGNDAADGGSGLDLGSGLILDLVAAGLLFATSKGA